MSKKTNLFNKHSSNEQCTLVNSYLECITFFREEIPKIKNRFDLNIPKNGNRFDLKIPTNENCLGLLRFLSTVCDFRDWMAMKTWTFIGKMELMNLLGILLVFNCLEHFSSIVWSKNFKTANDDAIITMESITSFYLTWLLS